MAERGTSGVLSRVVDALLGRKAVDPVVLDLRGLCAATDYFVIVSGTSNAHVRGMADAERSFDQIWNGRVATNPAGRFGQPAELGAYCAFLCSTSAGFVTGLAAVRAPCARETKASAATAVTSAIRLRVLSRFMWS